MGSVVTEFQRSLDEIRQEGREEAREQGQVALLVQLIARKFGRGRRRTCSGSSWEALAAIGSPGSPPLSWTATHPSTPLARVRRMS